MPISRINALAAAAVCLAAAAAAQDADPTAAAPAAAVSAPTAAAGEVDLDALLWVARPLVVFADSPNDPRFAQQMTMLEGGAPELTDRLVVVLTDTDPAANGPLRQALRPVGFGLVLLDTDGSVIQRRPTPTTVRELTGTIDRLPSRRQETGSRRQ